jgi:hypothetical protein
MVYVLPYLLLEHRDFAIAAQLRGRSSGYASHCRWIAPPFYYLIHVSDKSGTAFTPCYGFRDNV